MDRSRIVVALIPPAELLADVQALRRSIGDRRLDRLAPHITLVPPVNVPGERRRDSLQLVDEVARATRPFELTVGPVATFAPETPTLHLSVHGALEQLVALRDGLLRGPFDRPDPRPFVPHVTLRNRVEEGLLPAAVALHDGVLGDWVVDRVSLLEQQVHPDGGTRWVAVHEAPFGDPVVVGRGGVELELRTVRLLEPPAAELLVEVMGSPEAPEPAARASEPLVVCAAAPGEPDELLGVALGSTAGASAHLSQVAVVRHWRNAGIGTHLVRHWCSEAAASGCRVATAAADPPLPARWGFVGLGGQQVRSL